jgi:hypothetical protein
MAHRDDFVGAERQRVESVLRILTAIAERLETKHDPPTDLITHAFEFVRAYEQEGRETDTSAGETPSRLTVDPHIACAHSGAWDRDEGTSASNRNRHVLNACTSACSRVQPA